MLIRCLLPHLGSREASRHTVNMLKFSLSKGGKMQSTGQFRSMSTACRD